MKTKIVEAVQSKDRPSNWGKFLVMVPDDEEWGYESQVDPGRGLMQSMGYWGGGDHVWVLDMQTGEGAFFRPGGSAGADLEKHAVWVCPLYQPFLEWLYERCRENGGLDLDSLPEVVELPGAEFALRGHRRPGPEEGRG